MLMFVWCHHHPVMRNSHAPSAAGLESTVSIGVRICSMDKKMGNTDCEVERILKMHKVCIKTGSSECCYWCFSEFCWKVCRKHTCLKCLWLQFASVLRELASHVNKGNPDVKYTLFKEERDDKVNVIWEGKCILTCQFYFPSLFWATSKSSKTKNDLSAYVLKTFISQ